MRSRAAGDDLDEPDLQACLTAVARQRDLAAFEQLFRHYAPRLRLFMARQGGGQRAEELMQETMLAVWNKADRFDPARGNASQWVFTIARNLRIDAYRRDRRPAFDPADPAFVPDAPQPADDRMSGLQQAEQLRRALSTLPDEQKQLLHCAFFEELPHSAIARRFGLPIGTVKSRIRLAYGRLRQALEGGQ